MADVRECRECGSALEGTAASATFCSAPCRKAFHNRRAMRGAILYDLWMANRYDRGIAKVFKVLTLMCALGKEYREEDVERRGHAFKSWLGPRDVIGLKPRLAGLILPVPTQRLEEGFNHGDVLSDQKGDGCVSPERAAPGL